MPSGQGKKRASFLWLVEFKGNHWAAGKLKDTFSQLSTQTWLANFELRTLKQISLAANQLASISLCIYQVLRHKEVAELAPKRPAPFQLEVPGPCMRKQVVCPLSSPFHQASGILKDAHTPIRETGLSFLEPKAKTTILGLQPKKGHTQTHQGNHVLDTNTNTNTTTNTTHTQRTHTHTKGHIWETPSNKVC